MTADSTATRSGSERVKVGVVLPSMSHPDRAPGDVVAAAQLAERLGFESVWTVDQLIAGTGNPVIDATVVLSAAAAVTTRVRLGYGVMIVPLRPAAWIAKQVASLQYISGDRVILGVGAGGDRHTLSWDAVGVPSRERGRRTDAVLRALPDLIAGRPTELAPILDGTSAQLSPAATVPELLVGGMSDAAMRRTVDNDAGWFIIGDSPAAVGEAGRRIAALAADRGRSAPSITTSMMVSISGDPAAESHQRLIELMSETDGMYGMPPEVAEMMLVEGSPSEVGERLAALGDAGADRVIVNLIAGDWFRQVELLAEATTSAGLVGAVTTGSSGG